MIVDTSALLAILRAEPEARSCAEAIEQASVRRISAGTFLETAYAIDASRDPIASRRLDELVQTAGIVIEPVTQEQAQIGRAAYRDFGKGNGHPAQLNFGDCFAYALASALGEPLLFSGASPSRSAIATLMVPGRCHGHRFAASGWEALRRCR